MKVLIDAQLPRRLVEILINRQVDAIHTLDLPRQNTTPDQEIIQYADEQERIVCSKDSDFLDNYILNGSPKKLLIVSTGNIRNSELIELFDKNIETLGALFKKNSVIEINEIEIIVHY